MSYTVDSNLYSSTCNAYKALSNVVCNHLQHTVLRGRKKCTRALNGLSLYIYLFCNLQAPGGQSIFRHHVGAVTSSWPPTSFHTVVRGLQYMALPSIRSYRRNNHTMGHFIFHQPAVHCPALPVVRLHL